MLSGLQQQPLEETVTNWRISSSPPWNVWILTVQRYDDPRGRLSPALQCFLHDTILKGKIVSSHLALWILSDAWWFSHKESTRRPGWWRSLSWSAFLKVFRVTLNLTTHKLELFWREPGEFSSLFISSLLAMVAAASLLVKSLLITVKLSRPFKLTFTMNVVHRFLWHHCTDWPLSSLKCDWLPVLLDSVVGWKQEFNWRIFRNGDTGKASKQQRSYWRAPAATLSMCIQLNTFWYVLCCTACVCITLLSNI